MRTAADGAVAAGEDLRRTADEATKAGTHTGTDWGDPAGQRHVERVAAEADGTRAAGDHLIEVGQGLRDGADVVDGVTEGRVADIEQGTPLYEMAPVLSGSPQESGLAQDRMVNDAVARGKDLTEQGKQLMKQAGERFMQATEQAGEALRQPTEQASEALRDKGWNVTPIQYERAPVDREHRLETKLGDKKLGEREMPLGANRTGTQAERSRLTDPSVTMNYDNVRDASVQLDSGLRNLDLAGNEVPVHVKAEATAWRSDVLPNQGGWYTEHLDTPTPKAGRFEGRAAWGAGAQLFARAESGDAAGQVFADSLVGAEAKGELDVGQKFVGVGGGGFAGAKAGVSGYGEYGGFGAGGKVEGQLGVGASAGVTFGEKDGKWVIGGKLGAALGVGGKLEGQLVLEPGRAAQTLKDLGSTIVEGFQNPGPVTPYATYY